MKTHLLPLFLALVSATATQAADPTPKETITAAAKKLGEQTNYSWTLTTVVPESMPFKPGPTEGKTEKAGFTYVTMSFGDNLTEAVIKGEKSAITDQDGAWKLTSELENAEGPGRFMAGMVKAQKTPAVEAVGLLDGLKELKKDGDAFAADLTDEGVKKQFRFGEPKDPKGSVKFWVKDGLLAKYEVKVSAKMDFNGNEFDASRTATTEIKAVGTTKVNIPTDAKKKFD